MDSPGFKNFVDRQKRSFQERQEQSRRPKRTDDVPLFMPEEPKKMEEMFKPQGLKRIDDIFNTQGLKKIGTTEVDSEDELIIKKKKVEVPLKNIKTEKAVAPLLQTSKNIKTEKEDSDLEIIEKPVEKNEDSDLEIMEVVEKKVQKLAKEKDMFAVIAEEQKKWAKFNTEMGLSNTRNDGTLRMKPGERVDLEVEEEDLSETHRKELKFRMRAEMAGWGYKDTDIDKLNILTLRNLAKREGVRMTHKKGPKKGQMLDQKELVDVFLRENKKRKNLPVRKIPAAAFDY